MGFIYKISNNINNKLYIGKTCSTIENRWSHHKNAYQKYDWHLYKAMRKYGINNFKIEIIEQCDNNLLNEREMYWINKLDTYKNGYNSTTGGDGRLQIDRNFVKEQWLNGKSTKEIAILLGEKTHSSTVVDILKELQLYDLEEVKKRKMLEVAKSQSGGEVIQYNEDGQELKRYNSVLEAATAINGIASSIQSAIYSGGSRYGFFWSREGRKEKPNFHKITRNPPKAVLQYTKDNIFIKEFPTAAEAGREVNAANASSITAVCRGRRKTAYGYIWRYKNDIN